MQLETSAPEQPLADSGVEDRIASIFGNNEPDEPQDTEQPQETEAASQEPAEETFELEHEGEKFVLPKKLEKGFMQEKDYTQKSQSLAEQRRTLEHVQQQMRIAQQGAEFQQSVKAEQQEIFSIDSELKQLSHVDWSSMTTDQILKIKLRVDQLKDQRDNVTKQLETKQQQFTALQQQQIQQLQSQSTDIVRKAIPAWNEQVQKEVREHALNDGYTAEEIGAIFDPRHAITLWKAAQYDKAKSQAKPAIQQAKIVKPGSSNPMSERTKQDLAFRKAVKANKPESREYKRALEDRIGAKFGA
jgi:hypothetical protein